MITLINLFLLINFQFFIVQCEITNLSVRKVDKKTILQKREDNKELCRIFNEADKNSKLDSRFKRDLSYQPLHEVTKLRAKRDIGATTTTVKSRLTHDDEVRLESLVDKLYDEGNGKGKRVTYRQKILQNTTKPPAQDGRKKMFFFAPKLEKVTDDIKKPEKHHGGFIIDTGGPKINWPKYWNYGVIPYFIDPKTYDSHLSQAIMTAFDYFEKATCIRLQRLREKPTDTYSLQNVEWIYITNPSGIRQCVHSNERKPNKGVQVVVIGYDCMSLGEVAHEVMHILGFSHEHTRPDRDRFVTILWDNIKPGYKKYFETRPEDTLLSLPYDFASVLHYPARAFSRNGQVTIMADGGLKIGQREGISEIDVEKVNLVYGNDCMERNKNYLLTTCPSVVKSNVDVNKTPSQREIQDYFKDRLWPYGVVNYKLKDLMEFSAEERENIKAVIQHIEKETCIQFNDPDKVDDVGEDYDDDVDLNPNKGSGKTTFRPAALHAKPSPEVAIEEDGDNIIDAAFTVAPVVAEPPPPIDGEVLGGNEDDPVELVPVAAPNGLSALSDTFYEMAARRQSNDSNSTVLLKSDKSSSVKKSSGKIVAAKPKSSDNAIPINEKGKSSVGKADPLAQKSKVRSKRAIGNPKPESAGRRHAENVLTLTRSAKPGCTCPSPGKKGDFVLELSSDCFNSVNDLLHVFVHVLGLDHQHNMHDRDNFLHIMWNNLTAEIKKDMSKVLPPAASVGFPYDYQSVMHFPWLQIKDGISNVMYPIWNDGWAMGHWQGLSSTDVQKLNLIYYDQCLQRKKATASSTHSPSH